MALMSKSYGLGIHLMSHASGSLIMVRKCSLGSPVVGAASARHCTVARRGGV